MGKKRKERSGRQETLIPNPEAGHHEEEDGEKRFFACYLLCSLSPRFKGHTYIGFTVNPCRRIRQHNGEIASGAWRTKRKRPWEMVLCIYGFSTNVAALQFEWAWQHPRESLAVRKAAASMKSLSGVANHIKLAYMMLTLPPWQSLKLTVNFFSTKYTKHSSGCPSLPKQMKVQVCPMDDLSSYIGGDQIMEENEDDDWEDEDNENGNSDENVRETQMDMPVHNSVHTSHDLQRPVEDCDLRQQRDSRNLSGDYQETTYPSIGSPSGSTGIPSLDNTGAEDREPSWLIGESTKTLGRPTDVSSAHSPCNDSFLASPEGCFKQRKDSFAGGNEEDEEPSSQFDSPVIASSSPIGMANRMEVVANRNAFGLTDLSSKIQQASKHHLESPKASNTTRSSSTNSFHFSSEVEVINLLTPSSDCVIGSFHKKKRATRACHDIIDLTKSPLFVQL